MSYPGNKQCVGPRTTGLWPACASTMARKQHTTHTSSLQNQLLLYAILYNWVVRFRPLGLVSSSTRKLEVAAHGVTQVSWMLHKYMSEIEAILEGFNSQVMQSLETPAINFTSLSFSGANLACATRKCHAPWSIEHVCKEKVTLSCCTVQIMRT